MIEVLEFFCVVGLIAAGACMVIASSAYSDLSAARAKLIIDRNKREQEAHEIRVRNSD
jgi:hypothetical protein